MSGTPAVGPRVAALVAAAALCAVVAYAPTIMRSFTATPTAVTTVGHAFPVLLADDAWVAPASVLYPDGSVRVAVGQRIVSGVARTLIVEGEEGHVKFGFAVLEAVNGERVKVLTGPGQRYDDEPVRWLIQDMSDSDLFRSIDMEEGVSESG